MSPADGDGITDEDGITFAGAADLTNPFSAFSTSVPIPANVASNQVQISGVATMNAASGDAVLFVSVSTLEKGVINTKEVTISQIEKGSVSLFNDIGGGCYGPKQHAQSDNRKAGRYWLRQRPIRRCHDSQLAGRL